jgi:hypothetical protein
VATNAHCAFDKVLIVDATRINGKLRALHIGGNVKVVLEAMWDVISAQELGYYEHYIYPCSRLANVGISVSIMTLDQDTNTLTILA